MVQLPQLNRIRKNITNISDFRGLNRTCNTGFSRIASNNTSAFTEFKDIKNLSSDKYPQLSPRPCRARVRNTDDTKIISNILSVNSGLIYIDGNGLLHHNGQTIALDGVDVSETYNLIQYGNNIVILPLKIKFNLSTQEIENLDKVNNIKDFVNIAGPAKDSGLGVQVICSIRKTMLDERYSIEPTGIGNKDNYDTATLFEAGGNNSGDFTQLPSPHTDRNNLRENAINRPSVLYKCTSIKDKYPVFIEITDYYIRLSATGIGIGFKNGDYIKISGMEHNIGGFDENAVDDISYIDVLNDNYFRIYAVSDNYIVIKANLDTSVPYCGSMTVTRAMPSVDENLIVEVNNRLWTCSSESNEIFACKQGDCTNWQAYSDGIITDSFAMTVGCEGEFTGIARQNDSVLFFKENWVLKIYGTKPSNYTLATYNVLGVAKGSSKSIVWINGVLYYLSNKGVCQYSPGSQPVVISEYAFGDMHYKNGVAGRHRNKYYISAQNEYGEYELFVFDTETGLWHKEDNTQMLSTTTYNNTMYYVDGQTGCIMCPDGKDNLIETLENFEQEGDFEWNCETGDLYDSDFNTKYISRINIGLRADKGIKIKIYAQFSEDGSWSELRTLRYDYKQPRTIPVAIRRAEYLKLKIKGTGQCEIYGIDIEYARGSDKR